MPRIYMAASAALARTLDPAPAVTVEAEYGEVVVEGTVYTAAHHQKTGLYQGQHTGGFAACPCIDPKIPVVGEEDTILVSHLDLDTVGGVIRAVFGRSALFDFDAFWEAAAWVDVNGVHKLRPDHPWRESLAAWWAWLQTHRPRPNREEAQDVTLFIDRAYVVLVSILCDGPNQHRPGTVFHDRLMAAGSDFLAAEDALNNASFMLSATTAEDFTVAVRVAPQFANHLYRLPEGIRGVDTADAIIALNTETGGITLSFANPDDGFGFDACDIVRVIWPDKGPDGKFLAGGHPGIAGGPRGRDFSEVDLLVAFSSLLSEIAPSSEAARVLQDAGGEE